MSVNRLRDVSDTRKGSPCCGISLAVGGRRGLTGPVIQGTFDEIERINIAAVSCDSHSCVFDWVVQ